LNRSTRQALEKVASIMKDSGWLQQSAPLESNAPNVSVEKLKEMPELAIPPGLLEAVRSFPAACRVEYCGQSFEVSAFEIYAACPHCGTRIKVRSFIGATELEDLFDAVFEWMRLPGNSETAQRRIAAIASDADG
jgi:hypothetical protein